MEVQIWIPKKSKMAVVETEYPDIYEDGDEKHDDLSYFVGKSSDETLEPGETEWMTRDEAITCCGFVEGAIPKSQTLLEGNGGWAQGMMRRKDFSGLAISKAAKREFKRESDIYWKAFRRGKRKSRQCDKCGASGKIDGMTDALKIVGDMPAMATNGECYKAILAKRDSITKAGA